MRLAYNINLDKIKHSRSVYTLWDMLGDIGGLFGILQLFARHLLSLIATVFGSGVDRYLTSKLFKKQPHSEQRQSKNIFTLVKQRKPAKISIFNWMFCRGDDRKL